MKGNGKIKPLTPKQAKYVDARASGLNKKDALAAYGARAPAVATELEQLPHVRAALSMEYAKNARMAGLSRMDVIEGLQEAIRDAKILSDPSAQIAGWREIAKICGYYAPEVKKLVLTDRQEKYLSRLEMLDDAELLALAEAEIIEGEFVEEPTH